jgi:hypothetical protein
VVDYWKPFVFYALAPAFRAGTGDARCDATNPCLEVIDAAAPPSPRASSSP